ncbi:cytochrome bc complex cytochrome b subunit [Nannocystis pusilla]|uniref:Cytochrome bc complex cytochrome b subunit n=1 Tax=Nannocystis pusilla TaxID=889268 RepID=A0A9X3EZE3_9BACT|nr:cytochrome bc complex cytochrome b subunit [Nannocystis pusilla]MCY1013204.1 cytochrome bc complex cytochrome b subunit [Nannocystis pusilla]
MALLDWLDERTGIRSATRLMLEEDVPGGARLRYVFGSVLVFLFMQQVVLGILLAFYYSPSATDAWASTAYLNDQVTSGWFLRGLHHHGSSAMVVVVVLHLLQVVFAGAYRKPREVNWWTGLLMGAIVLAFALTGYLLPWDQKGYWATQVATGIMGSVPGGEPLQQFVQGGPEYGNLTLTRFFALHVFVLPIALAGLLGVHLLLFRKHGVTPPDLPEAELQRKTQPFWPNQLFLDVLAMAVCAAVLVGLTVKTHGAELFAPADPASNFVARPEWYFLFLFQLLKYFQGPLQIVATVLLPGAAAVYLFALPFVDRAKSRAVRSRWAVLSGVGILMAGVTALTAVAIAEDNNNESFQHGVEQAHAEATRARARARGRGAGRRGRGVRQRSRAEDPQPVQGALRDLPYPRGQGQRGGADARRLHQPRVVDGPGPKPARPPLLRGDQAQHDGTTHHGASQRRRARGGGGIPDRPVGRRRGGERGRGDGRSRQGAVGQEARVLVVPRARGRQRQHGADAGRPRFAGVGRPHHP